MNQNVEKYVNGLSPMDVADIVISYEGTMYKNWCMHEGTPKILIKVNMKNVQAEIEYFDLDSSSNEEH